MKIPDDHEKEIDNHLTIIACIFLAIGVGAIIGWFK